MNPDTKMETLKIWLQHISYTVMWKKIKNHKVPITFGSLMLAFTFLYAALAPNIFEQGWDALMYTYWYEIDGIKAIWGNHPLGHVIYSCIYICLNNLGYDGKALPVNILINSLFGGTVVALFFYNLYRLIRVDYFHALGFALILGVSYSLWHYSGTADIYTFSVLTLLLAWSALIYEVMLSDHRFALISGFLTGASILSHQLNGVFLLVAFIVICSQKNSRWTRIISYFGSSLVTIITGYVIFGYIATSSLSVMDYFQWTRGYLGDPIYGTYLKLESFPIALKTLMLTVLTVSYGKLRPFRTIIYTIFSVIGLLGIVNCTLLDRNKQIILFSALSYCLVCWLLIFWFEPFYLPFWFLTLLLSMVVLTCCTDALEKRLAAWSSKWGQYQKIIPLFLVFTGLFVFVFNLHYAMGGEHKPASQYQESINIWLKYSEPEDMLITAGDFIPQLWFWEGRHNTVHLYHYLEKDVHSDDRFEYLRKKIDQHICSGKSVIFAPEIVDNFGKSFLLWLDLSRDDLRSFFETYEKEKLFTYRTQQGNVTQVYKLIRRTSCDYLID